MNTLKRWNQLRELEALQQLRVLEVLQHDVGNLIHRSPVLSTEGQEEQVAMPEWFPVVDISEDDLPTEHLAKAKKATPQQVEIKIA